MGKYNIDYLDPVRQSEHHLNFSLKKSAGTVKTIATVDSNSIYSHTKFMGWAYGDNSDARTAICMEFATKHIHAMDAKCYLKEEE